MTAHCDPLKHIRIDHLPAELKRELIARLEDSLNREDRAEIHRHAGQGPGMIDRELSRSID